MSNTQRPTLDRKHTRSSEAKRDAGLDRGIAFTDDDGTRLVVTVGDVKGSQDAQLVAAIGTDFVGLLEAMSQRQGTDLLAALVWFVRLVNGRDNVGTYESTLDEIGYDAYMSVDDARADVGGDLGDRPEA